MTGPGGPEPTFADVLNNLTMDSGRGPTKRRRRRRGEEVDAVEPAAPAAPARPPIQDGGGADRDDDADWDADEWGDPADSAAVVRPYAWTRGRTRPMYELAIETLVSTSTHGRDVAALTSVEHRAVAELCRDPRSLAEVAALLSLPLGVARVLLGDMADIGLVVVHQTASSSGDLPDIALMERVLSGLRRL